MSWIKLTFLIFIYIVVIIITTILHITIIDLPPFPFNQINIIFLTTAFLLILTSEVRVLWLSIIFAFLLELFSSMSFGILATALFISNVVVYWILTSVLTNRSVYNILFVGIVGILIYRSTTLVLFYLINFFSHNNLTLGGWLTLYHLLVETLMTSGALALVFIISRLFFRSLRPEYVKITDKNLW